MARLAPKDEADRYFSLDVLRGVAALAVLITHAGYYTAQRLDPSFPIWVGGGHGVDLFFVISGFVMVFTADRARDWQSFVIARARRILPLYWLATSMMLVLSLGMGLPAPSLRHLTESFLLLPTVDAGGYLVPLLAVGWTLVLEAFFYAAIAAALVLKVSPTRLCTLVLGACALGGFALPDSTVTYLNPLMLEFLFGMILAHLLRQGGRMPSGNAVFALATALLALNVPEAWIGVPRVFATGLPAGIAVWAAVSLEDKVRIPRWAVWAGAISYPLYLFHPIVARAAVEIYARAGLGNVRVATAVAIIASIAVAGGVELLQRRSSGRASDRPVPSPSLDQQIAEGPVRRRSSALP
ncbi:acyltransferase [Sphingomonas sp.]|jgi:peptidoglycan/LPS O-acetylase OafA/YrhL|uniref:acyltransferase family protein n=1 Tax=Sphingomonas sp. TaxID=28214 RepID=UPI002ED9A1A9